MSPLKEMKELTYAVRKQQRALEERLEACLEELRRLCLREAVRTTGPSAHPHLGFIRGPLEPHFGILGLREGGSFDGQTGA